MKKLASSNTIEGLEVLINKYFYSTSYKINPNDFTLSNNKGINNNFEVKFIKNKYVFLEK